MDSSVCEDTNDMEVPWQRAYSEFVALSDAVC